MNLRKIKELIYKPFSPVLKLPHGDKIIHFVVFGLLGFGALWLPRDSVMSIAMFAAFLGIIWEMFWHFFGLSLFCWKDVLAGWLGGLFFGTIYYFIVSDLAYYIPLN